MVMKHRTVVCYLLILLFLSSCREQQQTGKVSEIAKMTGMEQAPLPSRKVKSAQPSQKLSPWDIQGFRTGMGMISVKQLLDKKGITGYETGFSDLFVYAPAVGAEIRLQFTCGPQEFVLDRVELTTIFPASESDRAIATYWDRLVAKYGHPARSDAGPGTMDLFWGTGKQPDGRMLEAKTTVPEKENIRLIVTLSDQSLVRSCVERRAVKIDRWLNQWIGDVQKFSPGMGFKSVAAVFQKRYRDRLLVSEERDEGAAEYPVTNLVATDYDYFDGLNYDTLLFEGEGPGTIILKFTGDQAGKGNSLNQRLYYTYFSTTKFTDKHLYSGMQHKLDRFIKAFGNPVETTKRPDGITARWVKDTKQRVVIIEDSGLISLEQWDFTLRETYRNAAVKNLIELNRNKFNLEIF